MTSHKRRRHLPQPEEQQVLLSGKEELVTETLEEHHTRRPTLPETRLQQFVPTMIREELRVIVAGNGK